MLPATHFLNSFITTLIGTAELFTGLTEHKTVFACSSASSPSSDGEEAPHLLPLPQFLWLLLHEILPERQGLAHAGQRQQQTLTSLTTCRNSSEYSLCCSLFMPPSLRTGGVELAGACEERSCATCSNHVSCRSFSWRAFQPTQRKRNNISTP